MESTSTPRISAALMDSYVGHNVIIVGKVVQLRGDTAFLEADGQVQANLNRDCHLMVGNGAQIIGKVNPDLTIKVLNALDLGPNVVQGDLRVSGPKRHELTERQQSSSQQSQSQLHILAQTRSQHKQKQKVPTVAELSVKAASTAAFAASSNSQSSRVITQAPLINQLSQLSIQETQSSQYTTQPSIRSTQPSQFSTQPTQLSTQGSQYTQHIQYTQEEATSSQRKQKQKSSYRPVSESSHQQRATPTPAPAPSSDRASSRKSLPQPSAPAPDLAEPSHLSSSSWWSPFSSWITAPPPQRHGRLYRTKSGNLATAAEIRQRRERESHENDLLDMILEGFSEERSHAISFYMDEVGRWRIIRRAPIEVEEYALP
ncbi:hypothetical protein F5Y06DRAFT_308856 [Hypoxylon sp. FL0890]|nr:hypothetical protein F5Y06DRAFT_308856 [Hypoxylon sp. FL0890]